MITITKKTYRPFLLFIVILCMSCKATKHMPLDSNPTPVAQVGNEVITRGFLNYTTQKLSIKNISDKMEDEILQNIIDSILISRKAEMKKLNTTEWFQKRLSRLLLSSKIDFLCDSLQKKSSCHSTVSNLLIKHVQIKGGPVDWQKFFKKKARPFIPFGSALPDKAANTPLLRKDEIDKDYASSITITTSSKTITLYNFILELDDISYERLRDAASDQREYVFSLLLIDRYYTILEKNYLHNNEPLLLKEVLLRTRQNLLVEAYKKSLSNDAINLKNNEVTFSISNSEARAYYTKNKDLFQEPIWVEIAHIRVSDYKKAQEIHRLLKKDIQSFCQYAQTYSIAEDAKKCGRSLIRKKDAIDLPLYKKMGFTLARPGDISVPFLTPEGTEIVMLVQKKTYTRPFSDPYTKKIITEELLRIKRMNQLHIDLDEMKSKHIIRKFTQ